MASKFYFFTDTDLLSAQPASDAYGPAGAVTGNDRYRVTSLHKAGTNPSAYAICDGIVCVQRIISNQLPALVNIILKPLVQPDLNFVPVKYFIYKGILEASLIAGAEIASTDNNDLTKSIWDNQAKKNAVANTPDVRPSANALGLGLTSVADLNFGDLEQMDNLFYRVGVEFQLPVMKGGSSIGQFNGTGFGLEVVLEGLGFNQPLSLARQLESNVSVPTIGTTPTPSQLFDHWHDKEQVLGYMDPCAFYGSFFSEGILARTSTDKLFSNKSGKELYSSVLTQFANKNTAYLDIRNEHNLSFNYFKNYGFDIKLGSSPTPVDYYASKWPILTLNASHFPANNTTKERNAFQIQLPVGDNPQPLVYVSQGYRNINIKGDKFPAALQSAERFYDNFDAPFEDFTVTKNMSGLSSMTFVIPNVIGQSVTTPVSCYIRLKYLKQRQGKTIAPTVIQSSNHLDNLFYPIDLRLLFNGPGKIKSFVFDEEVYVNAQKVAGLWFDFIGKVGVARDAQNTSFFLMPTSVRKSRDRASELLTLTGETSDYSGDCPNFVALKFRRQLVDAKERVLSISGQVNVAQFHSNLSVAARKRFKSPDFSKFFMIVIANETYDSWKIKVESTTALDKRFRIYLGVVELPTETDIEGVKYTPFELVLRGFTKDKDEYKVQEMNSDSMSSTANIKVFAYASA